MPHPLSECIQNELQLREIIWELKRYSLIKEENGKISIHRLLQEVIREEDDMKIYYEYAFNTILYNIENVICNCKDYYYEYQVFYPHILSLCKCMTEEYKEGNILFYKSINWWFEKLFKSEFITSSIIASYVKSFFESIILLCFGVQDLNFFTSNFIWLINENQSQSNYINSMGNYFLPLLKRLDSFPDSISCAFYIVLSIVGGRNGWKDYDRDRDLKYLERAKKIYAFYGKIEAVEYISDYKKLVYPVYKWDKEYHDKLLR